MPKALKNCMEKRHFSNCFWTNDREKKYIESKAHEKKMSISGYLYKIVSEYHRNNQEEAENAKNIFLESRS